VIGDVLIVSDVSDQLMADHIGKVIGRLRSANWARSWVDDCLLAAVAILAVTASEIFGVLGVACARSKLLLMTRNVRRIWVLVLVLGIISVILNSFRHDYLLLGLSICLSIVSVIIFFLDSHGRYNSH